MIKQEVIKRNIELKKRYIVIISEKLDFYNKQLRSDRKLLEILYEELSDLEIKLDELKSGWKVVK